MGTHLAAGSLPSFYNTQIAAAHVFGLRLAEDAEHCWGDVAERAIGLQAQLIIVGNQDERNGICGVVGVRAAGFGVDHGFRVAVVGGDDPCAVASLQRLIDARESGVDRFDGFDGGFEFAGMAHHVGIGVIHYDGVELAFLDGLYHGIGDSCGGHFRFQIVGGDFRRRDENALFAGEWLFHAAIEEVSDVRVFFSLGAAQILVLNIGKNLREDMLEFFGANYVFQPWPVLVVLGHGHVKEIFGALGVDKFIEVGRGDRVGHLAGAVGAEVEENDRIVVADRSNWLSGRTAALRYNNGLHEFIGDV